MIKFIMIIESGRQGNLPQVYWILWKVSHVGSKTLGNFI